MRNLTNEMKKNALRIAAGAMTAISLAAAPLTVSAAIRTNNPKAVITTQVNTTSNGRAVTKVSVLPGSSPIANKVMKAFTYYD